MNKQPPNDRPNSQLPLDEPKFSDEGTATTQPIVDAEREPTTVPTSPSNAQSSTSDSSIASTMAESLNEDTPQAPTVFSASKKRRSRKPLVFGAIVAVFALLLAGGGASYAFWYQNPERVVHNAMLNLAEQKYVQTKTKITSDSQLMGGFFNLKLTELNFDADVADAPISAAKASITLELNGNPITLAGQGRIVEGDTVYFRIDELKDSVEKAMLDFGMTEADMPTEAVQQLERIQNRWVKLTAANFGADQVAFNCVMDAVRTHAQSDEAMQAARDNYLENKFVVVGDSVGAENGAVGYKVQIDNAKLKDYLKNTDDSKLQASLNECTEESVTAQPDDLDGYYDYIDNVTLESTMWVSRFSHQLKQVDYVITTTDTSTNRDYVFDGTTSFNYDKPNVEAPSESVDFEEWSRSLEDGATMLYSTDTTPTLQPNQMQPEDEAAWPSQT